MRISMVSAEANPLAAIGGMNATGRSVHVAALGTALARRGHHVTVYTRMDAPGLPDRVELSPRFELVRLMAGPTTHLTEPDLLARMANFADGLALDWLRTKPDIVHSQCWVSGVAAVDSARRKDAPRDIPLAQSFHGIGAASHQGLDTGDTTAPERKWLEPWVARNSDTVIAACSDEAFEVKSLGIPSGGISVVPCGVDLRLFGTRGDAEERLRPFRLVTIGQLVPRHGFDVVIRALARLVAEGIDADLVIIGGVVSPAGREDITSAELRTLAQELGVADRVDLRGPLAHAAMPAILRSADAVVCAPWSEPSGRVALEAMACGIPVVASAVGGLIDTVIDGVTGVHVPPRDPEAVATALACLLVDESRMASLGVAGSRRAANQFTWEQVAIHTERAYRKAARRGKARVVARGSEGATR